jgi:hypothetical protein
MKYENQYIKFLTEKAKECSEIRTILEDYLLNNIDFSTLTERIETQNIDVEKYRTFKKSLDIDKLLED